MNKKIVRVYSHIKNKPKKASRRKTKNTNSRISRRKKNEMEVADRSKEQTKRERAKWATHTQTATQSSRMNYGNIDTTAVHMVLLCV